VLTRHAEQALEDALADTPVVLIHGPRQTGKSTLAQAIVQKDPERRYVTLDDPIPHSLAKTNPAGFLKAYPAPIMIDEVQRAPELFLAMKADVDRDRRPGKYLLTGSANVLALPKMADSLAGRMEIVDRLPFSQGELEGGPDGFVDALFAEEPFFAAAPGELDIVERMVRGGFPEPSLRTSPARRANWYTAYVRSMLERDVRDLANIEALAQMPRLFALLAARAGTTLNVASLSTDTDIPYTSLKRYLDLLKTIFLLQLVPAWSSDRARTLTKAPKAYLVDTGLLCHLTTLDAAGLRRDPLRLEPALENFVAMELAKQCAFGQVRPWLMHLRTVRHLEVDFVLEARGGSVAGVEVTTAEALRPRDADGLRFLAELAGDRFTRGLVLYQGDDIAPLDEKIMGMPISCLWGTGQS
jgi:predicted AAA+ superfamily ATPase